MTKNKVMKKVIITCVMVTLALAALTACTKKTESLKDAEASESEEDLPQDGGKDDETAETEGADGRDAGTEDGSDAAASEETELMGMIENVPEDSDDSFIVAKLVTEEVNGMDLVGVDPDDTKITVVYSDETKFIKQTIRKGGEDVEEKEGSAADLKENFTAEMKGSYSGEEKNVFFATDVKIVEVILD